MVDRAVRMGIPTDVELSGRAARLHAQPGHRRRPSRLCHLRSRERIRWTGNRRRRRQHRNDDSCGHAQDRQRPAPPRPRRASMRCRARPIRQSQDSSMRAGLCLLLTGPAGVDIVVETTISLSAARWSWPRATTRIRRTPPGRPDQANGPARIRPRSDPHQGLSVLDSLPISESS